MRRWRRRVAASAVFSLLSLLQVERAAAQAEPPPIAADQTALQAERQIQLEIVVNDVPANLIEPFRYDPASGRLSARRRDLEEAGIRVPGAGKPDDRVALDPSWAPFRYDEAGQRIAFTLDDAARLPRLYNAQPAPEPIAPRSDIGALLNYTLFAGAISNRNAWDLGFSGANATLDARIFSEAGVFSQTGIVGSTTFKDAETLRLETAYTYSDPDRMVTYRAGDTISSGLPWTRPIRMAGLQVQRDFTLRPDLVTAPVPQVSGSAAVPSGVDVFVNGIKTLSQEVGPGPFSITNLPMVTANGTARVVVRDASGREVASEVPLLASGNLLAQGLTSFSAEAGFARRNYGYLSNDYNSAPLGSATLRYGLTDWLTLEAHGEGGAGIANGGLGSVTRFGRYGILSTAISGSLEAGKAGLQGYAAYEAQWQVFSLRLAAQRSFGQYDDLASAVSRLEPLYNDRNGPLAASAAGLNFLTSRPTKELYLASVGAPVPWAGGNLSLSFVHLRQANEIRSSVIAATYSRALPWNANLSVSAYADVGDNRSAGAFATLTMPLGPDIMAGSISEWTRSTGASAGLYAQKSQGIEEGSYGWRVRDSEGRTAIREASASYRSGYGQAAATVQQVGKSTSTQAQVDGALALVGGNLVAGNRVDGSFAVVNTGQAGVPVLQDNRVVGTTDPLGRYLVPNLRAYQRNSIGIDPTALPVTFDVNRTSEMVAPNQGSGVYLDFAVSAETPAAIVVLQDAAGQPLPPGSTGRLASGGEPFVIGYDGRAYIRGLGAQNEVAVETGTAGCTASFAFAPVPGRQQVIPDVVCR